LNTIVFLHIPKTAGQTIHQELARAVGAEAVSPVRVHTQAPPNAQMPPGYRLYSGHIDWTGLEALPADRFTFTVLRDPLERIASFYFYLLDQAGKFTPGELAHPSRTGMRIISSHSAEDYFFAGDKGWQVFIRDHYDNFYCSYFATRKMRGWPEIANLAPDALVDRAVAGAAAIDAIHSTADLSRLEDDLSARLGTRLRIADRFVNAGPEARSALRWPKLADRLGSDAAIRRLESYAAHDRALMDRLGV